MRVVSNNPHFDIHATSVLASAFSSPKEVLSSRRLSNAEKRCVLAAWASDAFAVEGRPWERQLPNSAKIIPLRDIMKAIRSLDDDDGDDPPNPCPAAGAALAIPMPQDPVMAVGT